ncbi:hypothetical protein DL771_002957 [Monosporascus sp. 5C6A]|nr:hypothetical protein DL771_002957 [Monosporascus sp. 5C6A]
MTDGGSSNGDHGVKSNSDGNRSSNSNDNGNGKVDGNIDDTNNNSYDASPNRASTSSTNHSSPSTKYTIQTRSMSSRPGQPTGSHDSTASATTVATNQIDENNNIYESRQDGDAIPPLSTATTTLPTRPASTTTPSGAIGPVGTVPGTGTIGRRPIPILTRPASTSTLDNQHQYHLYVQQYPQHPQHQPLPPPFEQQSTTTPTPAEDRNYRSNSNASGQMRKRGRSPSDDVPSPSKRLWTTDVDHRRQHTPTDIYPYALQTHPQPQYAHPEQAHHSQPQSFFLPSPPPLHHRRPSSTTPAPAPPAEDSSNNGILSQNRRRAPASPIDVEASISLSAKRKRTDDGASLSLWTPDAGGRRSSGVGFADPGSGGAPPPGSGRELICLCTKAPKVPRPRNAFILYRQHHQAAVAAAHPGLANPEISKLIGEQWREQPEDVKNSWKRLAEEEKARHRFQYPDYRYQPRRGGNKGATANSGGGSGASRPVTANGEDPGRCLKCGGRYIATPRTPSTPFAAAAAAGTVVGAAAAPPPGAMTPVSVRPPPYANANPNHGAHPNAHPSTPDAAGHHHPHAGMPLQQQLRRGSAASTMSTDAAAYGRRYTQPHLLDIDEEYQLQVSPTAVVGPTPESAKRRRHNGPPQDAFPPGSPPQPMRYVPADRFSRPSFSAGQMAQAVGPGLPPRMSYRPASSQAHHPHHHPHPHPHTYGHPHMQPPRRSSVSYPPAPTPSRVNAGFDESLRLPPLQAQLPNSPNPDTNAGLMMSAASHHPVGLGMANGTPGPMREQHYSYQPQHQQLQYQHQRRQQSPHMGLIWSFLEKLDMLRAISPPLKASDPGFETRGPLIAIEGAAPSLLKEVTTVVRKALSISGKYAVRIWSENKESSQGEGSGAECKGKTGEGENGEGSASSIAKYMARMLRWHKASEELVKYMTKHPTAGTTADNSSSTATELTSNPHVHAQPSPTPDPRLLPVAVVSDGYSLTASDKWANALPINDAYRADDHWRWVATLWRGIVGADLTVYVQRCTTVDELRGQSCVEVDAEHSVIVLRVLDGVVDEKLERRLGFQIIEWVDAGNFRGGDTSLAAPAAAAVAAATRRP